MLGTVRNLSGLFRTIWDHSGSVPNDPELSRTVSNGSKLSRTVWVVNGQPLPGDAVDHMALVPRADDGEGVGVVGGGAQVHVDDVVGVVQAEAGIAGYRRWAGIEDGPT